MIRYLHTAAGFPTRTTWLKAIEKGFLTSWPGLTATAVERHFPESEDTQKGYMRKMKLGVCSTKHSQAHIVTPSDNKQSTTHTAKVKDVMVRLMDMQDEMKQTCYRLPENKLSCS